MQSSDFGQGLRAWRERYAKSLTRNSLNAGLTSLRVIAFAPIAPHRLEEGE
jgi:hypothetical protein